MTLFEKMKIGDLELKNRLIPDRGMDEGGR